MARCLCGEDSSHIRPSLSVARCLCGEDSSHIRPSLSWPDVYVVKTSLHKDICTRCNKLRQREMDKIAKVSKWHRHDSELPVHDANCVCCVRCRQCTEI